MTAAGERRPRRSTAEIRAAMLDAGRTIFGEYGYHRANTRDIAERAGVAEILLFRHFGSKRGLFRDAVLEPVLRAWQSFETVWFTPDYSEMSDLESARLYVATVYDSLVEQRDLIIALHGAATHEDGFDLGAPIDAALRPNTGDMERTIEERDFVQVDAFWAMRLSFGLILAAAVFDDWLYPAESRPSREEFIEQLAVYVIAALTNRDKIS
ncbi:TetR/AcrR family transcriptional regulator [Actinomadura physcomitrii]|nr:TetR/AcrR family transcriptional regulator [Actinomadura physcomitrii]